MGRNHRAMPSLHRILLLMAASLPLSAGADALVAVAANFTGVARTLGEAFQARDGLQVRFSFGSTGKLYAQIVQGAPFDALLAADQARPARLEAEGLAVAGTRFTYARGRLVLWTARPGIALGPATLADGGFRRLALANPDLAPYGAAARQVLESLALWDTLQPRLVRGENVGQAYALVASGNAELGFVAASQVVDGAGSRWEVPPATHDPIRQDAVLLVHGRDSAAARGFLAFLQTPDAQAMIRAAGYATD